MPRPVCVPCGRFYKPDKNGVLLEERMPVGVGINDVVRGAKAPDEQWAPYKLWMTDRYRCPGCDHQIVHGFGLMPVAERFQREYEVVITNNGGVDLVVKDC